MGVRHGSALLALIVSAVIPQQAASAAPLLPSSIWSLDYGATQCTAVRTYGNGSGAVTLGIAPALGGNSYRMIVSLSRTGPTYARELAGSVDLGQGPVAVPILYYGSGGTAQSAYEARIPAAQMHKTRSAGTVTMRVADGASYSFSVPGWAGVLDGLAKCTADLQQYWNLNSPAVATAPAVVNGDIGALITRGEFPTEALRRNELRASVQYQVMIDEKGAVAGCDVLASSGIPTVDTSGCDVIKQQARFEPARVANGQPVRSVFTSPVIVWKSRSSEVFDSSCSTVSGNTNEVISMCGRQEPRMFEIPRRPPPPPPPPPPKG